MNKGMEFTILEYFGENNAELKVLDESDSKKYTGVTIDYVIKYVLKNRFTRKRVISKLLDLHTKEKIKSLYCPDIQDIIFHTIVGNWTFDKKKDINRGYGRQYERLIEHIELKKQIK